VKEDAAFTRPYFSRPDLEQPYYDISDERYLNRPLTPYPLEAWSEVSYSGVPVRLGQVVQTTRRTTGYGPVFEPLVIGPAIGIAISPRAGIVPFEAKSFPVTAVVRSNVKGPAKGIVRLALPAGWKSDPASSEFSTAADGDQVFVSFTVTPSQLAAKEYQLTAVAQMGAKQFKDGYEVTGYPGLRPYFLYRPATYRTSGVDVKVAPGLRVAYIMGSGDEVPAALEHLGIKTSFLTPTDLASGNLSNFDVILLGVRT
jgi:NPCBM-associated, NEW3 domain of alpha-galactosidase